MPIFKPKNTKKIEISKKTSTTLDGKHKEITESIKKEQTDVLPSLKKEKRVILQVFNCSSFFNS